LPWERQTTASPNFPQPHPFTSMNNTGLFPRIGFCLIASATVLAGFIFPASVYSASAASARNDVDWLKTKGTLLFEDSFDREETGNGLKGIGNGWESATADRVPHIKQADLDQGILKINSATKEAGHGAHIHHDVGFEDGGVHIRFKFPGINKGERLQVGFVDRECKTVHAGHLCYAFLGPDMITLKDSKTGAMNLDVSRRSEEARKATGKVPEDIAALLKTKEVNLPWKADNEWHDMVLVTEGDVMRLSLDGRPFGEFKSEGFSHPVKRWMSFITQSTVWVDEVKAWKVK